MSMNKVDFSEILKLKDLAQNSHITYNNWRLSEPILELFRKEEYYMNRCVELEKERNQWKDYAEALERQL